MNLAEGGVGDAARGGAVLAGGRDGRNDRDMAVAGEMCRDLGEAADVLAAIGGREAEIAVEAGAQRVAVEQDRRAAIGEETPLQRPRQRRLAGGRQAGEPDNGTVVAIARGTLVRSQRRFHRHDVDRHCALAGIDRQHQAAAGDASGHFDHEAAGARVLGVGIGGNRIRKRNVDLADMGSIIVWALVRYRFPGRRIFDAIVDVPFALPTAVAGVALTALFAEKGWLGAPLAALGIKVAFTPVGIFVAMQPI